jgi:hypothetical protein
MRTRLLFLLLLISAATACGSPTAPPSSRAPASPVMDLDTVPGDEGQHGSGSGG